MSSCSHTEKIIQTLTAFSEKLFNLPTDWMWLNVWITKQVGKCCKNVPNLHFLIGKVCIHDHRVRNDYISYMMALNANFIYHSININPNIISNCNFDTWSLTNNWNISPFQFVIKLQCTPAHFMPGIHKWLPCTIITYMAAVYTVTLFLISRSSEEMQIRWGES